MKAILEPINSDANQSFHFGLYDKNRFESPWHYHPQWELTYVLEGNGTRNIGNSIQVYFPGELILVGPNLPHRWNSNNSNGERAKSIFIQFDAELLGQGWLEKSEFLSIKKMLSESDFGILFTEEISKEIGEILLKMETLSPMNRLLKTLSILDQLATSKYNQLSLGAHFNVNKKISKRIESIMNYLEENYNHKINATQLGDLVFMTPVSFSKFFKKTFNKTFTSYLNEYRISKACELLRQTSESVEEIAFRTGYQNLSFFHRQFKLFMKVTPASYRVKFS
jgi:AraC-like DNA-binding protein